MLWRLQKRHSHPLLPVKFTNPICRASLTAASRISVPRTFTETLRSCVYHFNTASSNSLLLHTFICFLLLAMPSLLPLPPTSNQLITNETIYAYKHTYKHACFQLQSTAFGERNQFRHFYTYLC